MMDGPLEAIQDARPNSFRNLLRFDNTQKRKPMVIAGHRGGFKPDNSMHAFKKAKQNQLQAIELDIWITTDNQLAVFHGGYDGEMPLIIGQPEGTAPLYIYNMTLAEARDHFSKTQVFLDCF